MSSVKIMDKRGGVFEVEVDFTYGECSRLPFNSLRKVNAKLEQIRNGGVRAISQFNLRNSAEAANFVELLDLFGEDGSFVHGSPADPDELKQDIPEDDEEPAIRSTMVESAQPVAAEPDAVLSSENEAPEVAQSGAVVEDDREEADDLEIEPEEAPAGPVDWVRLGDEAVAASLGENESRSQTLARVAEAAGEEYTAQHARESLIRLLYAKFKDAAYVAAFLRRRDWKGVNEAEVEQTVAAAAPLDGTASGA